MKAITSNTPPGTAMANKHLIANSQPGVIPVNSPLSRSMPGLNRYRRKKPKSVEVRGATDATPTAATITRRKGERTVIVRCQYLVLEETHLLQPRPTTATI